MKILLLSLLGFLFSIFCSCRKTSVSPPDTAISLVDSAKSFFEGAINTEAETVNPETDTILRKSTDPGKWLTKTPDWGEATIIAISTGQAILVPLKYEKPYLVKTNLSPSSLYSIHNQTKLLIYKDRHQQFHAEKLIFYPDSNYLRNPGRSFTGIALVQDWKGETLNKFKFEKEGIIRKYSNNSPNHRISNCMATAVNIIEICYQSYGYNYSSADPSGGYYWTQDLGCDIAYIDDCGGGNESNGDNPGGGDYAGIGTGQANGGSNATNIVTLVSGNSPINNVTEYLKCFTNTAGGSNTYSVTLCVEQPEAGSREAWGLSGALANANPVSVGHVFIIFNETTSLGSTIRNVGFYPKDGVNPYAPQSQGQLNNDASHDYNIALTINMTSSQFTQVLNFTAQGNNPGYLYNLNMNNCTTFALNALSVAGFTLPRTTGTWLNGAGLNPGDLGEDIRQMQLPANMTRTELTGTHPNKGFCY